MQRQPPSPAVRLVPLISVRYVHFLVYFRLMIFPWDKDIFAKAMKHAIGIGVVGVAVILIGWGEIVPADIFGLGVSVPLIAYLIHVVMIIERDHKEEKKKDE